MEGPDRPLEDALRLHAHRPATLVGLANYLHDRSNGMIGSLLRLIRLDAIPLDIASESGCRR